MTTQSKIELALFLWINNDKDYFKKIISEEKENILNYKGRGNVFTYFLPALLVESFWNDLQDIDFPLEKIVSEFPDIVSWLSWDMALEYMKDKNPKMLDDFIENGLYEENFSPMLFYKGERNYDITLDYFNFEFRELLENAINTYLERTEEDWIKIETELKNKYEN